MSMYILRIGLIFNLTKKRPENICCHFCFVFAVLWLDLTTSGPFSSTLTDCRSLKAMIGKQVTSIYKLVWWILILITFSGQLHPDTAWGIPYSFDSAALLSLVLGHTPGVPIPFMAHLRISLSTWGTHFLKPTPRMCLWMLPVCCFFTALLAADCPCFFLAPLTEGAVLLGPCWKAICCYFVLVKCGLSKKFFTFSFVFET